MVAVKKHLDLLGLMVKDEVTGFTGVVTSISFDLYGCIQAIITPKVAKDGKKGDSHWHDVSRLTIKGKKPVIKLPDFDLGYIAEGKKGAAPKPLGRCS